MTEIPYMMTNTRAEFERVRDLAWPVTDRTAATDAEFRSRIAPFESAMSGVEQQAAEMLAADRRFLSDVCRDYLVRGGPGWTQAIEERLADAERRGEQRVAQAMEALADTLDLEAHDDDATRAVAKWETADRIRLALAPQAER